MFVEGSPRCETNLFHLRDTNGDDAPLCEVLYNPLARDCHTSQELTISTDKADKVPGKKPAAESDTSCCGFP